MTKDNSEYLIERYNNVYEVVIGLEVHAQVTSNSKFRWRVNQLHQTCLDLNLSNLKSINRFTKQVSRVQQLRATASQ